MTPQLWVPDKFQLRARNFLETRLKARQDSGLFLFPGFGKTSIVLSAITRAIRKGRLRRVLVIAPLNVAQTVWMEESTLWDQFCHLKVTLLHGKDKERALREPADIHVINYDGLAWLAKQRIRKNQWDLMICDESSYVKRPNTARFRALRVLKRKIPRGWILNGSPIAKAYMDLFGQALAMDNGKTFGSRIGKFRTDYFREGGWAKRQWLVTPKGKRRIKEKITPSVFSLSEEDHLDLPPLITKDILLEFPPPLMAQYKKLMKTSILKLPEGKVTAVNAGVLTQKAVQFTSGCVYLENFGEKERKYSHVHSVKEQALISLVEELQGNPVLVGYRFKSTAERIRISLKPHVSELEHINSSNAAQMVKKWNEGNIQVMIGYPGSISHGMNLQKFPEGMGVIVFYDPTQNYGHYDQMIRRIHRRGFKRPVVVYRFLVKGTIDIPIIQDLEARGKTQEEFMKHVIRYWENFE